jgi:hypothetical protein
MKVSRRDERSPGAAALARDVAHKEMLMDEVSVTRPSPPSAKAIVADEGFCRQVAALLLCDQAPIHDAFVGEPVEEVLEMVRWALSHEDDVGFDAAQVLTSWAKKRGRGARGAAGPGACSGTHTKSWPGPWRNTGRSTQRS